MYCLSSVDMHDIKFICVMLRIMGVIAPFSTSFSSCVRHFGGGISFCYKNTPLVFIYLRLIDFVAIFILGIMTKIRYRELNEKRTVLGNLLSKTKTTVR